MATAAEVVHDWSGEFPLEASAVPEARATAADLLRRFNWTGDRDAVLLIVSELVTNAVRYARNERLRMRLAVSRPQGLAVEVTDEQPGVLPKPTCPPSVNAESGRGLFLVHALGATVTVSQTTRGKTVRAELEER